MQLDSFCPQGLEGPARGSWKLLASILMQALDDGCNGNVAAHAWIMSDYTFFNDVCEALGVDKTRFRRLYKTLKVGCDGGKHRFYFRELGVCSKFPEERVGYRPRQSSAETCETRG